MTESVLHRLRDRYLFERRGSIDVKGKGEMVTYFLLGRGERTDESTVVKEDKTSPAE